MTKSIITISLNFHRVVLIVVATIFLVLFLATAHDFNLDDMEQAKYFLALCFFVIAAIFLLLFKKRKEVRDQKAIYLACILGLVCAMIGFVYLSIGFFEIDYGDDKPYLIFLTLSLGVINDAFLLFVFLFRKELLFSPE